MGSRSTQIPKKDGSTSPRSPSNSASEIKRVRIMEQRLVTVRDAKSAYVTMATSRSRLCPSRPARPARMRIPRRSRIPRIMGPVVMSPA